MARQRPKVSRGAGGVAGLAALAMAAGCIEAGPPEGPPGGVPPEIGQPPDAEQAALIARARARGTLPVLVGLDVPFTPEGTLSPAAVAAQRRAIAAAQGRVLASLGNPAGAVRFETVPFFSMQASVAQLERLFALPEVSSVVEDMPMAPMAN